MGGRYSDRPTHNNIQDTPRKRRRRRTAGRRSFRAADRCAGQLPLRRWQPHCVAAPPSRETSRPLLPPPLHAPARQLSTVAHAACDTRRSRNHRPAECERHQIHRDLAQEADATSRAKRPQAVAGTAVASAAAIALSTNAHPRGAAPCVRRTCSPLRESRGSGRAPCDARTSRPATRTSGRSSSRPSGDDATSRSVIVCVGVQGQRHMHTPARSAHM